MQHDHEAGGPFEFAIAPNSRVLTCKRVAAGEPILYVSHDGDGDWQLLCGGEHEDGGADGAVLSCLRCLVERDPSLNQLAQMCRNHEATRTAAGQPWTVTDRGEEFIRHWVEELGWAIQIVEEGASDAEPPFAYTVGLTKSFGHPELIVVGQKPALMKFMLNECAERVKSGARLKAGTRLDGVIEGFEVEVRAVEPQLLRFLGYARWFYGGTHFQALQVVWPDFEGRFPGDPTVEDRATQRQQLT